MSKQQKQSIKKIKNAYLHEAFSYIYGNNSKQSVDQLGWTLRKIKNHLNELQNQTQMEYSIFNIESQYKQIANFIFQTLSQDKNTETKYPNYQWKMMPDYGCGLVLGIEKPYSSIDVYVVFGTAWGTEMQLSASQIKQFLSKPQQYKHHFLGKIETSEISLRQAMYTLNLYFIQICKANYHKLKGEHSPSWVIDVFETALGMVTIENGKLSKEVQFHVRRQPLKIEQIGGFTNVGIENNKNKPDTNLPLCFSLIYFFTQNNDFLKILQISYQISLLKKAIKTITSKKQKKLKKSKSKQENEKKNNKQQQQQQSQQQQQQSQQKQEKKSQQKQQQQSQQKKQQQSQQNLILAKNEIKLEINNFIKCLQFLIANIAKLQKNKNIYLNKNKAQQVITKLYQNLSFFNQQLNAQKTIYQIKNLKQNYLQQIEIKQTQFPYQLHYDKIKPNQSSQFHTKSYYHLEPRQEDQKIITYLSKLISNTHYIQINKRYEIMQFIEIIQDCLFTIIINELPHRLNFSKYFSTIKELHDLKNNYQRVIDSFKSQKCQYFIGKRPNHQIHSYLWLLKTIISIIGFQSWLNNQKATNFYGRNFKVPLDFEQIYDNLTFLSFKAHSVAKKIKTYFDARDNLFNFFKLSQQVNENTQNFINQTFHRTFSMKRYLSRQESQVNKKVEELSKQIKQCHEIYNQKIGWRNHIAENLALFICPCKIVMQEEYYYVYQNSNTGHTSLAFVKGYTKIKKIRQVQKTIQCQHHRKIDELTKQIEQISKISKMKVQAPYTRQNSEKIVFFQTIPIDLTDIIDLILSCQISLKIVAKNAKYGSFNNYIEKNDVPINNKFNDGYQPTFQVSTKQIKSRPFFVLKVQPNNKEDLVFYLDRDIKLSIFDQTKQFNDWKLLSTIDQRDFCLNKGEELKRYFFAQTPQTIQSFQQLQFVQQIREHSVYQKTSDNKISIDRQEFILYGSLRVGQKTQIILTLSQIFHRTICINSLQQKSLSLKNVLKMIFSTVKSMQNIQNTNFNNIVNQSIKNFLGQYHKNLTKKDFKFFPIIGPIIAILSQYTKIEYNFESFNILSNVPIQIQNHEIFVSILKESIEISNSYEDQIKKNQIQESEGKINKKFYYFSALCCFTQQILSSSKNQKDFELTRLFIQVYLKYKAIVNTQDKQSSFSTAFNSYGFILERSILCNLKTIISFSLQNPKAIVQIVNQVLGYHYDISRRYEIANPLNQIIKISYQNEENCCLEIDFAEGTILIENSMVNQIPNQVLKSEEYQELFENFIYNAMYCKDENNIKIIKNFIQDQNNKVCINHNSSLTHNGKVISFFLKTLKKQKKKNSKEKLDFVIGMNITLNQKHESWIRIPNSKIPNSKFTGNPKIPSFYLDQYRPWLNQKQKVIAFKKPHLRESQQTALLVFLTQQKHEKLIIIPPQDRYLDFNILKDNIKNYSQLQLHYYEGNFQKKQNKVTNYYMSKPIEILTKIQLFQYIHTIKTPLSNTDIPLTQFWLHRYDLKFSLDQQKGLLPETFNGYKLSLQPFTHEFVPWSESDSIPCLILQKIQDNELNYQMHKFKIIIPNVPFKNNEFKIPDNGQKMQLFTYDLHDHFKDLRGSTRQSQLHLALILTHINKGIVIDNLNITPIQYAIDILKSCINNRPLSISQFEKISNMIDISISQKYYSLILLCELLFKTSKQINNICNSIQNQNYNNTIYVHDFKSYCNFIGQPSKYQNYHKILPRIRYIYKYMHQSSYIPFGQQIPEQFYQILSLKIKTKNSKTTNNLHASKINVKIIENQIKNTQNLLRQVLETKQKLITNSQPINHEDLEKFNLSINSNNTVLLSQIQQQLSTSYSNYQQQINIENCLKKQVKKCQNTLKYIQEDIESLNKTTKIIEDTISNINNSQSGYIQRKLTLHPSLKIKHFTKLLTNSTYLSLCIPSTDKKHKQIIKELITLWMKCKIQSDSLKRLLIKLSNENIDIIQLMRECESPRQKINAHVQWNCFEVQMKLIIWKSQYETWNSLISHQKGIVSQLNMGEGKTQTIIPMMILSTLYSNANQAKTPRVNCLSSLYSESYANFYRFLSITSFNIPIMQLPFDRSVKLDNDTIKSIKRSLLAFTPRIVILLNHSSSHSMILKQRQKFLNLKEEQLVQMSTHNKDRTIFQGLSLFDIFDEVDALMSPKKEFIYSIGEKDPEFSELSNRLKVCQAVLNEIQKLENVLLENKFVIKDGHQEVNILKHQFSTKVRIIINHQEQQKILSFRRLICSAIIQRFEKTIFKEIFTIFSQNERKQMIQYIINPKQSIKNWKFSKGTTIWFLALRGLLGMGVLQFCLSLRYRVQYGIADKQRFSKTKLSVPYQAAEIPSKKNEFSHPQVSLILTFLTYYYEGLSLNSFYDALKVLQQLKQHAKEQKYKQWMQSVDLKYRQSIIKSVDDLNLGNSSQLQNLYGVFKKNKKVIQFWLQKFVFQTEMIHFPNTITSSCWDLACVKDSVGFSGTKDYALLFPSYIKYKPSENVTIRGTDARMIDLVLQNSYEPIQIIKDVKQPLWRILIDECIRKQVSCLIDVGAYLVGQSIKQTIIPYLSNHKDFNKKKLFKGIAFYHDKNWAVYNLNNGEIIGLRTLIQDNETFVIFDQYRTRGSDIKMDKDVQAILTLSPNLAKDDFMQATGRLRKFGRNQKMICIMTDEVKSQISNCNQNFQNSSLKMKIKAIINWTFLNSIKSIEDYIYTFCNHAKLHLQNQIISPRTQPCSINLQKLYQSALVNKQLKQECKELFKNIKQIEDIPPQKSIIISKIQQLFNKYGQNLKIQKSSLNKQTEKQKEVQTETAKQVTCENIRQFQRAPIKAIPQNNQFSLFQQSKYSWVDYFKFDDQLYFTSNFIKCTEEIIPNRIMKQGTDIPDLVTESQPTFFNNQEQNSTLIFRQPELQKSLFVIIKKKQNKIIMIAITQREAAVCFLKKNIPMYQASKDFGEQTSFYHKDVYKSGVIAILNDLTITSPIIKLNKLASSLVHLKFYNGCVNFSENEQKIFHKLIQESHKLKENTIFEIAIYFLQRRFIKQQVFLGSYLQSFVSEMMNDERKFLQKIQITS